MKPCQSYQSQMLEYLYDVLEAPDNLEFAAHIEQCAACRQALVRAEEHKEQLASAARVAFPNFRFQIPALEEHVIPMPVKASPAWFRWGVAAAILLAIVGLGIPAGLHSQQQDRIGEAKARLDRLDGDLAKLKTDYDANLDQADKELAAIWQDIRKLETEQQKEVNAAWTKVSGQPLAMTITGPKTPDPGATNTYNIQIQSRDPKVPAEAQLSVRLVAAAKGEAEEVIFEMKDVAAKGNYQLTLPRDLPLKPNTDLALEVSAKPVSALHMTVKEKLALVAPVYLTHLTTDKPMYQPGEVVHFRSLTLERFSLRPVQEDLHLVFKLTKPGGDQVDLLNGLDQVAMQQGSEKKLIMGPDGRPLRGIGAGEYAIDREARGGEYTLTVSEAQNRFIPQERKFIISQYEKPRLNKELEFTKKSYGAGETVVAACKVARVDGGQPVARKKVDAAVRIDGKDYGADGKEGGPFHLQTDDTGAVNVKFQLPADIEKGEATLSVTFHDADVEAIVRPIPIVLKKLFVEFFPEGGDLVAGVPNRVYFQARSTLGKPADLKGRIVDVDGQIMCDVQSLNDPANPGANHGVGTFAFTPLTGKKYQLKIDTPVGMEGEYLLPDANPDGVVLTIPNGVTTDRDAIQVEVRSAKTDRSLLIGAYCRGRLMAHQRLEVKKGEAGRVELTPESGIGGVYRVTVFEEATVDGRVQLTPRAERLIYREPVERLKLSIQADKQRYVPGDKVTLHCLATNEKGHSSPAILMIAVVDKSVLKLADEKSFKSMPTHFLLTTEVRKPEDLEHADFLLGNTKSAHASLDALLGTQGWRRFAEQDPKLFRKQHQNDRDADRLLVLSGQLTPGLLAPQSTPLEALAVQRVTDKYRPRLAPLQEKLAMAKDKHDAVEGDEQVGTEYERLKNERTSAEKQLQSASQAYAEHKASVRKMTVATLPALTVVFLLGSISMLLIGLTRAHKPTRVACLLSSVGAILLFAVLGVYQMDDLGAHKETRAEAADHAPRGVRFEEFGMAAKDAAVPPPAPANMVRPQALKMAEPKVLVAPVEKAKGDEHKRLDVPAQRRMVPPPLQQPPAGKKEIAGGRALAHLRGNGIARNAFGKNMAGERPARFVGAAMAAEADVDRIAQAMPLPACVVRVYAHSHKPAATTATGLTVRSDRTETIFWHPVLVLPDGRGAATFDLSQDVTTFQVLAAGHTLDGRIGAVTTDIESRLPVVLEPKIPIEVTASDKIDIPLTIANNSDSTQSINLHVQPTELTLKDGKARERISVDAEKRIRKLYRFQAKIVEGEASLRFDGSAEGIVGDSVIRTFKVVPDGFPVVGSQSDMLEKVARHELVLPETWVKGTLKYQVAVYPSTLADLQKGLEALLREPNGCFEQTSTSNYPNLLVLDYLKSSDQAKPEVAKRAQDLLGRGYQKLTSFECTNQAKNQREGYEWFGGTAPAHEALTAYGLMQFRDMARVHDVDKDMLERTKKYLLSRRDGKGGFSRNPRALDTFGRAPDHITNAYIVWALTESGKDDDITAELNAVADKAKTSKDPYFLALVANSLINRDRSAEAIDILKQIAALQQKDGHLDATETSITGSGGRDLQIETTALTLLGWLKAKRPDLLNANIQTAVKWIGQQRGGYGGFGSTQSTILALKALIAHAQDNKKTSEAGELSIYVDDQKVVSNSFPAGAQEAIILELPANHLKAGKNNLRVEISGNSVFPYTAAWAYQTLKPASATNVPVRLGTKLSKTSVNEGETVRLTVTVENVSGKGQGMTTAIVGLPAGLTLPEDMKQLKDLARLRNEGTQRGTIDFWETRGRELILYWRDLAPGKKVEVNIDVICRVPGEYRGPASRAYLYYNADHKHWVEPLEVAIAPQSND